MGNAVPPVLSAAVAKAIARKVGADIPSDPVLVTHCSELPEPVGIARRREGFNLRRFPVDRKFRDHVPGSRTRGFRVDVDNVGPGPIGSPHPDLANPHPHILESGLCDCTLVRESIFPASCLLLNRQSTSSRLAPPRPINGLGQNDWLTTSRTI